MKALISLLLFLLPSPCFAAWHLYVLPVVERPQDVEKNLWPKYIPDLKVPYATYYYGRQRIVLVAADLSAVQDTALKGNIDVLAIPDNLDQQIGAGALAIMQNALEARNIPANWLTANITYRALLRIVLGVFQLLQRYSGISGNPASVIASGQVTLDMTFSQLPENVRDDLLETAKSLNLNTSGFTGSSTLRQILKGVGDQFANTQWVLGGITI